MTVTGPQAMVGGPDFRPYPGFKKRAFKSFTTTYFFGGLLTCINHC